MSADEDPDRGGFEDVVRALADEVGRVVERFSEIDVDEMARTASIEVERVRHWLDEFGGRPSRAGVEDPLRRAGPHPLDLPTGEQGVALAALDSGRWGVEPGTSALVVHGEGPGPRDALGLVRELRVRDWVTGDGEITLAGRGALMRWLDAAPQ